MNNPTDIETLKAKQASAAAYIVHLMQTEPSRVTKQDRRFLGCWLAWQKAEEALAAGKPMPRAFNAGRRKKVQTGYGNRGGN